MQSQPAHDIHAAQGHASDIRGVLIAVANARLLLPNATVAEVITYSEPEPVDQAPGWLLGRVRWRGWRIPLLSFARLAGLSDREGERGSKVVVLKALSGHPRLPYFGLLTQGFPRLTTVARDALVAQEPIEGATQPLGVMMRVRLRDDEAVIPDLAEVEQQIVKALRLSIQAA
ncbi:MAG: chemotaxis protein CheW [Lysobacteraceae bacterium]|jgi:chemosensory pili system protein ChpC